MPRNLAQEYLNRRKRAEEAKKKGEKRQADIIVERADKQIDNIINKANQTVGQYVPGVALRRLEKGTQGGYPQRTDTRRNLAQEYLNKAGSAAVEKAKAKAGQINSTAVKSAYKQVRKDARGKAERHVAVNTTAPLDFAEAGRYRAKFLSGRSVDKVQREYDTTRERAEEYRQKALHLRETGDAQREASSTTATGKDREDATRFGSSLKRSADQWDKLAQEESSKALELARELGYAKVYQVQKTEADIVRKPDFAQKSEADPKVLELGNEENRPQMSRATAIYGGINHSPYFETRGSETFMTDEEVKIFTYLYNTQGEKAAEQYYDMLSDTLELRRGTEKAAGLDNTFERTMFSLSQGVRRFGRGIEQLFKDEQLPLYGEDYAENIINANASHGERILYSAANSIGNMLPMVAISAATQGIGGAVGLSAEAAQAAGKAAGVASMFAGAKGNAYTEAMQQGMTKAQASTYSTLVGASEAGLEYLIGGISRFSMGSGIGDFVQEAISGLGRGYARVAFRFAGSLIGGSIDEIIEENTQNYLEPLFINYVTGKEAEMPGWDEFIETTLSTLITTGVMESRGSFAEAKQNIAFTPFEAQLEWVSAAKNVFAEGTDVAEFADVLESRLQAGDPMSYKEFREGIRALGVDEKTMGRIAKGKLTVDEVLTSTENGDKISLKEWQAGQNSTAQQGQSQTQRAETVQAENNNVEAAMTAAEQEADRLIAEWNRGENSSYELGQQAQRVMQQLEEEVREGTATDPGSYMNRQIQLQEIVRSAPEASTAQQATQNTTEGIDNNGRTEIFDDGAQRDAGLGTGEQTGGMAAGAAAAEGERRNAYAGAGENGPANRRANLRPEDAARAERLNRYASLQSDTSLAQLVRGGSDAVTLAVIPGSMYDDGMRAAKQAGAELGVDVVFVRGSMAMQRGDQLMRINGVYDAAAKRAVVSTTDIQYDGGKLAQHELFHVRANKNPALVQQALQKVRETFGEEAFEQVAREYVQSYSGAYQSMENVYEEVLADAYAGMNRFRAGATQFTEAVQSEVQQSERASEPAQTSQETRGSPEGRFSLAGQKARTANSQTLQLAEQMEQESASSEEIWQETGWTRTMDGQSWRFEIDNSEAEYRGGGDAQFREDHADYAEYQDLLQKMFEGTISESEMQRMEKLDDIWSGEYARLRERVESGNATLADVLEHDSLYEAYPELRNVKVRLESDTGSKNGSYDPSTNTITISEDKPGDSAKVGTMLHEIQHAIQQIEGWESGASPEYWAAREYESGDTASDRAQELYSRILTSLDKADQNKVIRYNELDREMEATFTADPESEAGKRYAKYEAEQDKLYEELYKNEWFRRLLDLQRKMENPQSAYYEMYLNTAGEIEARNVSERYRMAQEERRKTAPKGADENTLFRGGGGISAEINEQYKSDLERWDRGGRNGNERLILGTTGPVLQNLGAEDGNIYLNGWKISKIMRTHKEMSLQTIEALPQVLENPAIVLASRAVDTENANTRLVMFGDVRAENGKAVQVVLDLLPTEGGYRFEGMQKVNSAYTKDGGRLSLEDSDVLYTDAKRAAQVLRSLGYQSGSPDGSHKDGYIGSIAYDDDGVKISGEKFTSVIGPLQKFSVQEELQDIRENGIRGKELAGDREETQPEDVLGYADDRGEPILSESYFRDWVQQQTNAMPQGFVWGKDVPFYSQTTDLSPKQAVELLEAVTGKRWRVEPRKNGGWRAVETDFAAKQGMYTPQEAANRLNAAKKARADADAAAYRNGEAPARATTVAAEGVAKDSFRATPALDKIGVKIDMGVTDYRTTKEMRQRAEAEYQTDKLISKAERRWGATALEKNFARDIAAGRYSYADIPDTARWDTVTDLANLYIDKRMLGEDLRLQRKYAIRDALLYKAMELLPDELELMSDPGGFDKEALLVLNYRTPQRSMLKMFGDKRGEEINRYYFDPVTRNEAERLRWMNRQLDAVREFQGEGDKAKGLNKAESAYVHMALDIEATVQRINQSPNKAAIQKAVTELTKMETAQKASPDAEAREAEIQRVATELDLNAAESKWAQQYAQFLTQKDGIKGEIDEKKCAAAVKQYRQLFDDYYNAIADFLVSHGDEPIGKIDYYAPHLSTADKVNLLNQAFEALGFNASATRLPAEIAGRTEDFRPNKRWTPFFQSREGTQTEYDIVHGFESYVTYLSDVLFHTDDIQKIRALENYTRLGGKNDFKNSLAEAIELSRSGQRDEKLDFLRELKRVDDFAEPTTAEINKQLDQYIAELFAAEKNNTRYSDLAVWLKNYGDVLAGKQFGGDRGAEHRGGRGILKLGTQLTQAFARANVAGNVSSAVNQIAQLPTILGERSKRSIAQATAEFATGKLRQFQMDSDFITGKKGVDYISNTFADSFMSGMFKPAEFVDTMMSTIAARAAYLDAIRDGKTHEEAMRAADAYARSIMGDRTKGAKPLMFHSKTPVMQMVNMFQIEALNSWEHVSQDLPRQFRQIAAESGKAKAARVLSSVILKTVLAAFVVNRVTEELYGGTPAPFDIIGMSMNFIASGEGLTTNDWIRYMLNKASNAMFGVDLFDDVPTPQEGFDWGNAVEDTLYNISNEVPFLSNLSGMVGVGDRTLMMPDLFGKGKDLWDAATEHGLISPESGEALLGLVTQAIPGGRQINKTYSGIKTIVEGGRTKGFGDKERLQYPVERNVGTALQNILFGPNATPQANAYWASGLSSLSTKDTQTWQTLSKDGADPIETYNLLHEFIKINADDTLTSDQAQRDIRDAINNSGLTDEQKAYLFRQEFGRRNKETGEYEHATDAMFETLMDEGVSWDGVTQFYNKLMQADGDENLSTNDKNRQKRTAIRELDVRDSVKAYIYAEVFGVADKETGAKSTSKDEVFANMMDAGMSWDDVMDVYEEYRTLYEDESLSSSQQASEFAYWLDQHNIKGKKREAIRNGLKYYQMFAQEAERYTNLTEAGLSATDAKKVSDKLASAKGTGENGQLTTNDKVDVLLKQNLTDTSLYRALSTVLSEETYDKLTEARSGGIGAKIWMQYWQKKAELSADKDANGKSISGSKKAKILALINSLQLTAEQKDLLYRAEGYAERDLYRAPWH